MSNGALSGVKILDFTIAAVGPFCSRMLADMGAEVIRIEWPRAARLPDDPKLGRFSPEGLKSGAHILFLHCNGGKKSICVNLKKPRGVEIVKELVKHADVVVENFTPHVMRNYGLDYEGLRTINPGIIMCSLNGYGEDGLPGYPDHPCTDPIAQAMGGLNWITGERDGPPYTIGGGIGDTMTSMAGAVAITSALYHKKVTGLGQRIEVTMVETSLFVDCTTMPYVAANNGLNMFFRNGQQNTYTFPMGPLKAKEGWISIQAPGMGPDSAWARLCSAMGRDDLRDDPRYKTDRDRIARTEEVVALIEGWFQTFPDDQGVLTALAEARISSGPVLSQEQILKHPYFVDRGTIGTVQYPELGPVKVVEPPYKLSETPAFVRGPAPQMGEHNSSVLGTYLGLSPDEVKDLTAQGVLFESPASSVRRAALGSD